MSSNPNNNDNSSEEAWASSKSKAILREGLILETITPKMQPKETFDANEEHRKWIIANKSTYQNWSNNLRNLWHAIARDKGRMQRNCIAHGHDQAIVKSLRGTDEKVPWHRSPAFRLLKTDIKNKEHETKDPQELYESRPEYYDAFDLTEFRKHLYQEIDSEPKRAARFEKKKKAWKCPELHQDHPRLKES